MLEKPLQIFSKHFAELPLNPCSSVPHILQSCPQTLAALFKTHAGFSCVTMAHTRAMICGTPKTHEAISHTAHGSSTRSGRTTRSSRVIQGQVWSPEARCNPKSWRIASLTLSQGGLCKARWRYAAGSSCIAIMSRTGPERLTRRISGSGISCIATCCSLRHTLK